jgi:hypothetical protein
MSLLRHQAQLRKYKELCPVCKHTVFLQTYEAGTDKWLVECCCAETVQSFDFDALVGVTELIVEDGVRPITSEYLQVVTGTIRGAEA